MIKRFDEDILYVYHSQEVLDTATKLSQEFPTSDNYYSALADFIINHRTDEVIKARYPIEGLITLFYAERDRHA